LRTTRELSHGTEALCSNFAIDIPTLNLVLCDTPAWLGIHRRRLWGEIQRLLAALPHGIIAFPFCRCGPQET
jgi:hypothetical protein